jgi:hypothetical protein
MQDPVFELGHYYVLNYHSLNEQVFRTDFLEETLCTLSLLFPQNDGQTQRWMKSKEIQQQADPMVIKCGTLRSQDRRFERFSAWHDRLVILKQTFDESSPQTLSQWWWDRRNGVQLYTFWVAVFVFAFTIFFGLVQSIEGGIQAYFSYKALQN